jgi:hypothetical protein
MGNADTKRREHDGRAHDGRERRQVDEPQQPIAQVCFGQTARDIA